MVANVKALNPLSELLSEGAYFSGSFFLQGLYGALSDAGNPINQTSGSGFIVKVPSGGGHSDDIWPAPFTPFTIKFFGDGITYKDDGAPKDGTITKIEIWIGGQKHMVATGLDADLSEMIAGAKLAADQEKGVYLLNDAFTGDEKVSFTGSTGEDAFLGGNQGDVLYGRGAGDYLTGQGGNDKLFGGDGRDLLIGGRGSDTLVGGKGDDELYGKNGGLPGRPPSSNSHCIGNIRNPLKVSL